MINQKKSIGDHLVSSSGHTAEISPGKPKRGEPSETLGAGRGGGGEERKMMHEPSTKRWSARDCQRPRWQSGNSVASFALVAIAGLLGGAREVLAAAYVDRGDVSLDCSDGCECTGSLGDGTIITVFDNPSSGGRVADVDGSLSDILETACGMSIIAAGDDLYRLSGLDLRTRDLEVLDMSPGDCTIRATPDSADCYTGSTSKSLSGGVELDIGICLCSFNDENAVVYKTNVRLNVEGADSVYIGDDLQICLGNGFISSLVSATVDDETHYYNFDLAISGEYSSQDLAVSPAPPPSAGTFMCDEAEPTSPPKGGDVDDDDDDDMEY